jgi:Mg2+ and Co2+ transporter CorA
MKILTIMAFLTFPLSLFSSLFGMNTTATPIIGNPHDFWIIVSIMMLAIITIVSYFRHKGWL